MCLNKAVSDTVTFPIFLYVDSLDVYVMQSLISLCFLGRQMRGLWWPFTYLSLYRSGKCEFEVILLGR